jgi:hypothetical protein
MSINQMSELQKKVSNRPTVNCRLCFLLISCISLYISVVSGLGCSQSFLGTETESMLATQVEREMYWTRSLGRPYAVVFKRKQARN